jgi:hypothetical protein
MRWTKEQYDNYVAKRERSGSRTIPKEPEDHQPRKPDNRPKSAAVEREVRQCYRVSITVNFSDNRRRDLDNAATTLLDCIVAAQRRLLATGERTVRDGKKS